MGDVDFGKIIRRSWQVTWVNKWLWVVGLVLAVFGGGTSFRSGGGSGSTLDFTSPSTSPGSDFQNFKEQAQGVLGVATNEISNWFSGIPHGNWFLLSLGIITLTIFFISISWVLRSWATGALILGFEDADSGKKVDLTTMSPQGISKIKDLIVLGVFSVAMFILLFGGYLFILAAGFALSAFLPDLGRIWIAIFGVLGVLVVLIFSVIFAMLAVYAQRLVVIKNMKPVEAWKKAFKLTRGNFLATAIMGIVNGSLGCLAGCGGLLVTSLIMALPGYLLIAPMFVNGFVSLSVGRIVGILIILFVFGTVNRLISGVFTVFNCGNWNQVFKILWEREELKNRNG